MALMESAHVLLVARRDPQDPIRRVLRHAGHAVVSADSVSAGIRAAERARPGVIVADPRALTPAGREALCAFAEGHEMPLILNWADSDALLAEVERRLESAAPAVKEVAELIAGPLRIDFAGHVATVDGTPLELTAKEFDLLCQLARHPGWVWSRQELLEHVWGYDFGDPRVVTVHMANLRKKVEAAAPGCRLIETVRNIGYKLVVVPAEGPSSPAGVSTGPSGAAGQPDAARADAGASRGAPGRTAADERRLVTVLVAYLGGLTALAEEQDSLRGLVSALSDLLVPCITRYGGGVHRFGADSTVALFGAPAAHDNDAEMAVRAGLDICAAVRSFAAERHAAGLSVHVGVNTGMVVAGWVEGATAEEYSVVGDAVEVAGRLGEAAGAGEVLVGAETLRLVGRLLEVEQAGTVKARGGAGELPFYRVKALGQDRMAQGAGGLASVLVGRDEQYSLLRGCLQRLEEGNGSAVFIMGEAGTGKSRLTAEVRREADARGIKWLEGRTLSYGQAMSYLPFVEILQADCGIRPDEPLRSREDKLRRRLERLFADAAPDFLPAMSGLLGLVSGRPAEHQPLRPEEDGLRRVLLERLTRYVSRLATEQPLVVAFEDVHWLDRSSMALITGLISLTARAPVLVCLKGRADPESITLELLEEARRMSAVRCVEVPLGPLSDRQTQELICNLLEQGDMEPAVVRAIQRKSEGNPFYVEEILRHLIDSGSLQRDEHGAWRAAAGATTAPIPSTIQGVIRARMDRLPDPAKQILLHGSVVGRSFFDELLRALVPLSAEEFDAHLGVLEDRQLVAVKRREPDLEYAFKHALIQEAAYDSLLIKQRKELHRQVAAAIEGLYSGRLPDLYGILAYHFTRAEDWDRAQDYLLKAGDQSVSLAADEEAVAHYEEAMAALLRAFDESWDEPGSHDRVNWFVKRTEPFWLARCLGALVDPAKVFYDRVRGACGPADPRTLAATAVLAGCYLQRDLYDHAAALVEGALAALEDAGRDDDASLSRLLLVLGLCRLNTDRFSEAESLLFRALEIEGRKASPDEGLLQDLYIYLGSAHFLTGRYEDLKEKTEEALRRFGLEGTQRSWMLLLNLCSSNLLVGDWDEAATQARQCVEGISNPYLRAVAARHLGEIRRAQGACLEAEEHLKYAIATLEEWGDSGEKGEAMAALAEAQLQAGQLGRAEATGRGTIVLAEGLSSTDNTIVSAACWTLAGVEMERGRFGEAEALLERSSEIASQRFSPRHPFCAELHYRRARLLALQGRPTEAEEDLERAIQVLAAISGAGHPRIAQMQAEWGSGPAGRCAAHGRR